MSFIVYNSCIYIYFCIFNIYQWKDMTLEKCSYKLCARVRSASNLKSRKKHVQSRKITLTFINRWLEEISFFFWKLYIHGQRFMHVHCGNDTDYNFSSITFKLHMLVVDDEVYWFWNTVKCQGNPPPPLCEWMPRFALSSLVCNTSCYQVSAVYPEAQSRNVRKTDFEPS